MAFAAPTVGSFVLGAVVVIVGILVPLTVMVRIAGKFWFELEAP